MTSHDLPRFHELFDVLATTFRLKGDRDAMQAAYFQALERYPIEAVELGYENLRRTEEYWPAPAKWIAAIPARGTAAVLPLMTPEQVRASDEAERRFYEGDLCACPDCQRAGVTHVPLRYVPVLDAQGQTIPLQHPRKSQPVLLGEWIHASRLRHWYAAKAQFYERLHAMKPKPMPVEPVPVLVKTGSASVSNSHIP